MEVHPAVRQKLTERYAEIRGRLERIAGDAGKPLDADFEEQAVERENDEVLIDLDSSIRAEMAQIEMAFCSVGQRRIRHLQRMWRSDYSEKAGGVAVRQSLCSLQYEYRRLSELKGKELMRRL